MQDYLSSHPAESRVPDACPKASRQASWAQLLGGGNRADGEEPGERDAYPERSFPFEGRLGCPAPFPLFPRSPARVIQRITSQLIMKGKKIRLVAIAGRPPRMHGSSMGDHLTAFCVQEEGLNLALTGCTLEGAIDILREFGKHLDGFESLQRVKNQPKAGENEKAKENEKARENEKSGGNEKAEEEVAFPSSSGLSSFSEASSPGLLSPSSSSVPSSVSSAPPVHPLYAKFQTERDAMENFLNKAQQAQEEDQRVHFIQLAIDAYLCAREAIPFSTINVCSQTRKGGHGHGEATRLASLSRMERCLFSEASASASSSSLFSSASFPAERVRENICDLFDHEAAALVAIEQDKDELAELTAHVDFAAPVNTPLKKLKFLWQQHLYTMKYLFPGVTGRMERKLSFPKEWETRLDEIMIERIKENVAQISSLKKQNLDKERRIVVSRRSAKKIKEGLEAKIKENEKAMEEHLSNAKSYQQMLVGEHKDINDLIKEAEREMRKNSDSDSDIKKTGMVTRSRKRSRKKVGSLSSKRPPSHAVAPDPTEAKPTLISQAPPMAVQIVLNDKGRIASLLADGRPPSPFSGTMGAHTIAWVVHLDRVAMRIQGMTPEEAMGEIDKIHRENFSGAPRALHPQTALSSHEGEEEEMSTTSSSRAALVATPAIAQLQRAIYDMYAKLNQKKGITRAKIDTTGRGEGTYRKTLINYEANPVDTDSEELVVAMNGLFDGGHSGEMWMLHQQFLQTAYPQAYAAVHPGDSSSATASASASMAASSASASSSTPMAAASSSSSSVTSGGGQPSNPSVYFRSYPFPLNAIPGLLPESEQEHGGPLAGGLLSANEKMEKEKQQDKEDE